MITVRKFVVAATREEFFARLHHHLEGDWVTVGSAIISQPGLLGLGRYRQVVEKQVEV